MSEIVVGGVYKRMKTGDLYGEEIKVTIVDDINKEFKFTIVKDGNDPIGSYVGSSFTDTFAWFRRSKYERVYAPTVIGGKAL